MTEKNFVVFEACLDGCDIDGENISPSDIQTETKVFRYVSEILNYLWERDKHDFNAFIELLLERHNPQLLELLHNQGVVKISHIQDRELKIKARKRFFYYVPDHSYPSIIEFNVDNPNFNLVNINNTKAILLQEVSPDILPSGISLKFKKAMQKAKKLEEQKEKIKKKSQEKRREKEIAKAKKILELAEKENVKDYQHG